jgi:hypothetical protein
VKKKTCQNRNIIKNESWKINPLRIYLKIEILLKIKSWNRKWLGEKFEEFYWNEKIS